MNNRKKIKLSIEFLDEIINCFTYPDDRKRSQMFCFQ